MRRTYVPLMLGISGLFVGWLGQGIWRNSPDELWAAVAVVSVLSASAMAMERPISRALSRVTRSHSIGR